MKDPLPLIEKSRASCPGGRFPPSFILKIALETENVKPSLKLKLKLHWDLSECFVKGGGKDNKVLSIVSCFRNFLNREKREFP